MVDSTTLVAQRSVYQLGQIQAGQIQYNGSVSLDYNITYLSIPASPRKRTQIGFGYYTTRVLSRPYDYVIYSPTSTSERSVIIEFSSISGGVLGKVRSDVLHTIFSECTFTLQNVGGCADCEIVLTEYPPFPIDYGSVVTIKLLNTSFTWYKGEISYADEPGSPRSNGYTFKANGFSRYMDSNNGEGTYIADDIAVIAKQISDDNIFNNTPITYNPAKLPSVFGVTTTNSIVVGKYSLKKVFDTLGVMSSTFWGVDGDGDFYADDFSDTLVRVFKVGYDLEEFNPERNLDTVKNVITVLRKNAPGGGAGWAVAGVYNNETSAKKYGRREYNYQGPSYWGQEEADLVGNSLKTDLAEPKPSAKLTKMLILSEDDYLPKGKIRIINAPTYYNEVIGDVDDYTEWSMTGTGDSTAQDSSTYFTWADGSVQFTWTNGADDIWTLPLDFTGNVQKMRFYLRSDSTGVLIRAGFGGSTWISYASDVEIGIANKWMLLEWDVRGMGITHIGEFGFKILANAAAPVNLWIDKIEVQNYGHKHYDYNIVKTKYHISGDSMTYDIEAGDVPPRLENYLQGLFEQAGEMKYTQESV